MDGRGTLLFWDAFFDALANPQGRHPFSPRRCCPTCPRLLTP
ncbi:conserved hypothetical protein [Verticillium alfalfae VaMs.102]|uniref:Uncharacterized protein n=1 Tax=Verticillium alfalfae (strain VaMs.102 / ATCC MYA-4576 / FGSC 10136) TaxID=526221 RepID=C9SA14_VERA1|nr:conserved hypothetical protein [Verticillium alfalfae VaMs.102]EEY16227.1 conserved hypothetical protein [Verticillium alfalfae VaMs.102]